MSVLKIRVDAKNRMVARIVRDYLQAAIERMDIPGPFVASEVKKIYRDRKGYHLAQVEFELVAEGEGVDEPAKAA